MKLRKIAVLAALAASSVLPFTAHADDSVALQTLINNTPDGGTANLNGQTYRLDGSVSASTILVTDRQNLTITNGVVWGDALNPDEPNFWVQRGSNITFSNLTIIGSADTGGKFTTNFGNKQHCIMAGSVNGLTIRNCTLALSGADWLLLGDKPGDGGPCLNVLVEDCDFIKSRRQGISGPGVIGLTMRRCTFSDAQRTLWDFEAEAGGASNCLWDDVDVDMFTRVPNQVLNISDDLGACGGFSCNTAPFEVRNSRFYGGQLTINNRTTNPVLVVTETNVQEDLPAGQFPAQPDISLYTAGPTIAITAPIEGTTVSGIVNITADVSDPVGVAKVEFWVDYVLLSTDTTAPYSFAWNTSTFANGERSIHAVAINSSGNRKATSSVTVTVTGGSGGDTGLPTATMTSPADGATVSGNVNLTANASDNVGVTLVEFRVEGVVVGSDTTSPYAFTWDSRTVVNGSYLIDAKARDAAGNTTTSADITVTVNNGGGGDTTAPTASITAPANGATVIGTVNVTANASDNVGVTKVEFLVDGVVKSTDTSSPYSFSWDTMPVSNGSHTLVAKAYDAANNTGSSSTVSVTVNNATATPPVLAANSSSGTGGGTASSLSVNHNIPTTGSNRLLVVGVAWKNASSTRTLSSMKYAGVTMTQVGSTLSLPSGLRSALFVMANPPTGNNTAKVTLSGAAGIVMSARTFTGVNLAAALAPVTATGNSLNVTVNAASLASELVVDWAVAAANPTATVGAGQTQDANLAATNSNAKLMGLASRETGAASTTMSWTLSENRDWGTFALPLKP